MSNTPSVPRFPICEKIEGSILINNLKYFNFYQVIFDENDPRMDIIFSSSSYAPEFSSYVKVGEDMVSFGGIRKKVLIIFGKFEPVPYIFGVATIPDERKKGYAGEVVKSLINKTFQANYNVIMISSPPHVEHLIKYYKKFGFTALTYQKRLPFENLFKEGFDLHEGDRKDCEKICEIYNEYALKHKLYQQRDIEFTRNKLEEIFAGNGKLFFLSKNNKNYAYFMVLDGGIDESLSLLENEPHTDPATIEKTFINRGFGEVYESLKDKTIEYTVIEEECNPESDVYTLIRIINPMNFMKKYANDIYYDEDVKTLNKNIMVEDPIIENSSFNIKKNGENYEFSNDLDEVAENIKISIADLTKNILKRFLNNNVNAYPIKNKFFFCENW